MRTDGPSAADPSQWTNFRHDLLPSFVVFLVALPLCMGIAVASGMPVASGLITGIVGGIVVGLLGGASLQVSGPAAGLTVIVFAIVERHGYEMLGLAILGAGIFQMVAGTLHLGRWFRAVSPAVVQGMLSGIGILIFASQFHVMFDEPSKKSGRENLLAIPYTLAKGLAFPPAGDQEERRFQAAVFEESLRLSAEQAAIAQLVEEEAAPEKQPPRADVVLVGRQEAVVRALEELGKRIQQREWAPLGQQADAERPFSETLDDAIVSASTAGDQLRAADWNKARETIRAAADQLEQLADSLRRPDLAGKVALATLGVILAWGSLRTNPLRRVPPQLFAIIAAVGLCFLFALPVVYVDVPHDFWNELQIVSPKVAAELDPFALATAVITIAVVASAETLLCAAAVDQMHSGARTQYDRELFAQGIGNALCGWLGGLPMTGVIVRSAANIQAGGRTRWSTVMHGVWLLLFVTFLTPVLQLIPTASLAAILVLTGYKLMNFGVAKEMAKYGRSELLVYVATVVGVVFVDLLSGVVLGIIVSSLRLLLRFAKLDVSYEKRPDERGADLRMRGAAVFLKLPMLADRLEEVPSGIVLYVHVEELTEIDHACYELFCNWSKRHEAQGGELIVDWNRLRETCGMV
ncbi:MAG: hypothetical protein C0483_14295 [Pirellula sp.]|nr:hypothetical protein [Pirellula sp.]